MQLYTDTGMADEVYNVGGVKCRIIQLKQICLQNTDSRNYRRRRVLLSETFAGR